MLPFDIRKHIYSDFLKEKNFFFQAEDGIRDRSPSRGLGDVYKRQGSYYILSCMMIKIRDIKVCVDLKRNSVFFKKSE